MATKMRPAKLISRLFIVPIFAGILFSDVCLSQKNDQKSPLPATQPPSKVIDCEQFQLNQAIGQGVFSSDGNYYFLARAAALPQSAINHKAFYKLDFAALDIQKVLEADITGRGLLITHGTKPFAISFLGFKDQELACARGHATGYSIVLSGKQKIVKTFSAAEYQVVPTDSDRIIIDLTSGASKEFDPLTLQIRKGPPLKKNRFYLFIDQKTKRYFALNPENSGVLERTHLLTGALESKLPLIKGDYLIQQDGLFAIARYAEGKNKIEIRQDAEWGRRVTQSSITLPKEYKVQDAALLVDFTTQTALVYRKAKNKYAQKWNKVMIWDLNKDQLISHRTIKENTYLAHAALSTSGNRFVVVMQNSINDLPTQIIAYDLTKQEWIKLKNE